MDPAPTTDVRRGRLAAVAFDFDGVILESSDIKTEAFVELFAHHGAAVAEGVREHHLARLGVSRFRKFEWIYEHLLGRKITDEESAELGDRFNALVIRRVLDCPMVRGAREALAALAT